MFQCQTETETCRGEEELASGRFQRTITKPIIVTVEAPPRAATSGRSLSGLQEHDSKWAVHIDTLKPHIPISLLQSSDSG